MPQNLRICSFYTQYLSYPSRSSSSRCQRGPRLESPKNFNDFRINRNTVPYIPIQATRLLLLLMINAQLNVRGQCANYSWLSRDYEFMHEVRPRRGSILVDTLPKEDLRGKFPVFGRSVACQPAHPRRTRSHNQT